MLFRKKQIIVASDKETHAAGPAVPKLNCLQLTQKNVG